MTDTSAANPRGYKGDARARPDAFTVCAILVVDQLAASAAIGPQAVFGGYSR